MTTTHQIREGQVFIHKANREEVVIVNAYKKTIDYRLSSGRIVPKAKIQPFLLSYEPKS